MNPRTFHAQTTPVAGVHYPRSLSEFQDWFPDEASCRTYLEQVKWPRGFLCPSCRSAGLPWRVSNHKLACPTCRHRTSVTAGTIFDKTRTELHKWFSAAWLFTTTKRGTSANHLHQALKMRSAETIWAMLHRYRRVMGVQHERGPLEGVVHLRYGTVPATVSARSHASVDVSVIMLREYEANGKGRIRMRRIADFQEQTLAAAVKQDVAPGSTLVVRDVASWAYLDLEYELTNRHEMTPEHVHSLLLSKAFNAWLAETYQIVPQQKYLDAYLKEFVFRFNRRNVANRGLLYYRLLQQATESVPVPLLDLTSTDRAAADPS